MYNTALCGGTVHLTQRGGTQKKKEKKKEGSHKK
jgi:hypothetical protein